MINRRVVLKAAAAAALLSHHGTTLAQSQPKRTAKKKKGVSSSEVTGQGDAAIQNLLAPVRDEFHLPGLIGAIAIGSRVAAIGAVGIRKIGSPQAFEIADQVHIGSCTKAMTATMIASVVETGKLSWTSTFRSIFPESADKFHPQFQEVTLSQLLTHRAGLPHDGPWRHLSGASTTKQRHWLMLSMLAEAPRGRPGSTYSYSNVGYALAALMAERVMDDSWESLMKKRLFEPLEMASAGFGPPGERGELTQPWGHRLYDRELRPSQQDNAPSMGPAGGVHCSMADWAKFAALHLAGERGDSTLLKPATLRALHVPPPSCDYAGGWMVVERSWAGGLRSPTAEAIRIGMRTSG